ncbi:hypothetical protein BIU96_01680 [Curtobacterium sp. MCBA15_008]|nr:FHA domain-containing protein [Curtobacterium sp. MCBA15_008]OII13529.1 hypothetical protein BIU96_01680 [Curtobacterium sp. MCBA15_008]
MLPDGAIFCGECGRAVTAAANRRPVAPTPVEQAPPPPLQQPDLHGRRIDPAADAWLPEATLDPATRAWLTGADRRDEQPPAPVPVQRPDDHAPRSAPTHVHGAGSGLGDWTGQQATEPADPRLDTGVDEAPTEPPLDPNAYPSEAEDPEVTWLADRAAGTDDSQHDTIQRGAAEPFAAEPVAPVWSPPQDQAPVAPPAGPSWWVGRSNAATPDTTVTDAAGPEDDDAPDRDEPTAVAGGASAVVSPPQPGDTAVVEPLVDRRPPRPAPLVTPGSQATTCHVCGHLLEPDDIFCGECGAVRPAVTAAFTGQIVPLPMDRPDWAADDSVQAVVDEVVDAEAEAEGDAADEVPERATADTDDSVVDDDSAASDDTPSAPLRPRGVHAAPVTDESPSAEQLSPPAAPASATLPSSAPVAEDTAAVRVPTAAPLPPLPGVTGPVLPLPPTDGSPTSADGDLEDDVEETRIVSKTPTHAPFVLHFSTGERFGVHGTGLVGRLPRPQPGERFDDLLTVHDPGKSVSKTHLELGRDGDDLWVSDRFSGNGTVVRHIDGSIRRCEPGRRYRVERGARVDIGEQFFLVQ